MKAEKLKLYVDDCGPLAGCKDIGVVFSLKPHGSGRSYFAKGKASEVCPLITKADSIVGSEIEFSEIYPNHKNSKCSSRKVFDIFPAESDIHNKSMKKGT